MAWRSVGKEEWKSTGDYLLLIMMRQWPRQPRNRGNRDPDTLGLWH